MALIDGENGNRRPSLTFLITLGGLLLGIGGTVVFAGGYLKQVEVNSARLQRIEQEGSPAVQTLKQQFVELNEQFTALKRDMRPREFWETNSAEMAQTKAQINELMAVRARWVVEWAALLQRVATLEAHTEDLRDRIRDVVHEIQLQREIRTQRELQLQQRQDTLVQQQR